MRTRSPRWLATPLVAAALIGAVAPTALAAPVVVSEADARKSLDVTVYNDNLALVREVRGVELPSGTSTLEFRGVPAQIEPRSLLIGEETGVRVIEQNYEFDLLSREKILEKYVGRDLAWIQEDGRRIPGRLLGMAAGPVFEVDGQVVFDVPGRLALPALPENLRARPTLVWLLDAGRGGTVDLEASYLTRGVSWSADYVLQLDQQGERAGLQAWVSIDNQCGATFEGARLLLVAGTINQVQPQVRQLSMRGKEMLAMPDEAGLTEEALYDYHLYTLPGTTMLKDAQIKQLSLFGAADIGVKRRYRVVAAPFWYQAARVRQKAEQQVETCLVFQNSQDNGLGIPLPAGVVRVYGQAKSGARQLLGEDRLGHTPRDEKIELRLGVAFDLVAERTQTDYRRVADNVHESGFRIALRNRKEEAVTIEVSERAGGDWRVLESSHPYEKRSATELVFELPVPAGGETVLSYRLQVTY